MPETDSQNKRCIIALVTGRVQGVFFRDSTRQQAERLNITGYAKNLADGRVEVLACGFESDLYKLVSWLHEGPRLASVSSVAISETDDRTMATFSIG